MTLERNRTNLRIRSDWSVYLHIPFCQVRCVYCDFNTYAGLESLMGRYAQALGREIRLVGAAAGAARLPVHTVFFGGGTPSLLPLEHYRELFAALRESFELQPEAEVTLEANPGTVDSAYLAGLRALGVNRLSFGVQSAQPAELRLLDRLHSFADVVAAVRMARAAGFDGSSLGLNLDLIFAIPHQALAMWQDTLRRVLDLRPEHLSAYALSLEHGTPLRAWVYRGLLPMPDPELAAEMYAWAADTLAAAGYEQYEISNWARWDERPTTKDEGRKLKTEAGSTVSAQASSCVPWPQYACRHNVQYWRNGPYLGFGAGAHGSVPASVAGAMGEVGVARLAERQGASRVSGASAGMREQSALAAEGGAGGWRYSNVLAPAAYVQRLEGAPAREFPFSPATVETTAVTLDDEMNETMMLGLRLTTEGVSAAQFHARFGVGLDERFGRALRHLRELGLLAWDEAGVRLTPAGRLLGNRVFREFV